MSMGKGGKKGGRGPMHFHPQEAAANGAVAAEKPARAAAPDDAPRGPLALPVEMAEEVVPAFDPEAPVAEDADALPARRRWPVRLLGWAIALLLSLAMALAIDALLRAAFARADWLGWLAAAVVGLAVFAALALAIRELAGLWRLKRIARLRRRAEAAAITPEEKAVRQLEHEIAALYRKRADMRWALASLHEQESNVMSPAERLHLLELQLMQPLDTQARRIILRAARDVAGLTAIMPAAVLDVLIVALRNLRMLRQLAALYGGRPGWLGGWRLGRMVLAHLALTGAIALTDAFLPHLLGKGLAGRLSARFGEGVVNGVLTARIGLAALEHVRPLPFSALGKPGLKELASALVTGDDAGA